MFIAPFKSAFNAFPIDDINNPLFLRFPKYVSCNPTTQARDARILNDHGYKIKRSTMVDMFPHTPHIETVMLFSK